jgi:micrococcal nuclease
LVTEPVATAKHSSNAKAAPGDALRWVEAVNGDCPDGYPVKANDNSGIYHVPGGRFYDRTVAERCYANADDALADGYRPAKA